MLKTEMEMKPKKIDINETKYKVENEELKEKIEELKHVIECRDEDINSQKFKYDAIINELNTKSEKLKVENVEIAYEVKGEEYIVELESKLEWYIDNQESFTDLERRIKKYEKAIQEFNQLLDTTIPSDSQNRDVKDVYRIKVLEAQVEDLKDEIKSRFREVPDLKTVLGKPRPFDVDVKVLKKRIYELENEKLDLRKSIQEFQVEGGFDEKVISKAVVDGLLEEETRLKKRIKELEALSETQTNLNNQLITEKHELVNHLSQKIHDQTQTIKSLEINRKHLDTQAQNLKTENTKVESQTQTQPQTQTQSQTLKTQNIKLEINLEKMKEENESLKLRIELLLSSRKTMQKNTLEILKQTQQQNSEIQIKYSEKTLSILKKEWANELKLKLGFRKEKYQQIIDSLSMKVKTLGKALVKKDEEIDCLEKDIDKLTDEYNTVNTIHKGCARFNTQLPPDIEEYDVLLQKIDSLEVEQQNREHKFLKNEKMWEGYQKKMGEKERELKGFQREITELIGIIGGLRKTSQ
jgi:chromosome segregation ATPase